MSTKNNAQTEQRAMDGMTSVQVDEVLDAGAPPAAKKAPAAPAEPTETVDEEVLEAAVKAAEDAAAEETEAVETPAEGEQAEEAEAAEESGEEKSAEEETAKADEPALVEDFEAALEAPPETKPAEVEADKINAQVEQYKKAANEWNFTATLLEKDPDLELAYLKAVKKAGHTLIPVHAARLAELEAQAAPLPAGVLKLDWQGKAVQATEQQLAEQHAKWMKEGKTLDAALLLEAVKKAKDEIAQGPARAAAQAKAKAEDEAKAMADADAKIQASYQAQLKALAPKLGEKYLKVHKNGFVEITDKTFGAALIENAKGVAPTVPLAKLVRYTLFDLKRLVAPKAKGAAKPTGKPMLQSSRSKTAKVTGKPKLPQGQTFVPWTEAKD